MEKSEFCVQSLSPQSVDWEVLPLTVGRSFDECLSFVRRHNSCHEPTIYRVGMRVVGDWCQAKGGV